MMTMKTVFSIASVGCLLYALRTIYRDAYRALAEKRTFDYHAFCAVSLTGTLFAGFIWASALGIFFAMLNRFLVAKTEDHSKQSISNLFGVQTRSVWMLMDGVEVETPFDKVQMGDIIVIHAGHMVPVDGLISDGMASIDQHMLTGESQPVEKGVGEKVLASTIVLSGLIYVQVEQAGKMTVAGQIGEMLSQTTDFKLSLQSRSERFMNQMVFPILGLSLLSLPLVGLSGAISILWYYPGSRMMMYGPLSMLSFLQVAGHKRILVKDGRSLETLREVDTVLFDKTGTLTLEKPTVTNIYCCSNLGEDEVLGYAAAAEMKQTHPIARAILQAAQTRTLKLPSIDNADYKAGYGIKARIVGHRVCVGSIRFMEMEKVLIPSEIVEQQEESHVQGYSLTMVALDGILIGAIELQPTIRPEAKQIVYSLQARGLEIAIISGDHEIPTRQLATELGIDRYFAEVLPEGKSSIVKELQEAGRSVCFIGDGINDSIALKQANVSVSMRGATTIATDAAQIVLMDGNLCQLDELFVLAEEFDTNMRFNLVAATLPGVVGIAGTLLFGWGFTLCVFLLQASTPVALYNSIGPLLKYDNDGESDSESDSQDG